MAASKPVRLETSTTPDDRADVLARENAELRTELSALRAELRDAQTDASAGKPAKRQAPAEPSFGVSEGTREELERNGEATSPFTGKTLTRDDL